MELYRELNIFGEPQRLAATINAIDQSISGDWSHDREAKGRMARHETGAEPGIHCYQRQESKLCPAVTLFLMKKQRDQLWVSNIVPLTDHELSYAEYNSVLEDFYHKFVGPAVKSSGADAKITESEADLEQWMTPETADKLRFFSRAANKRTGASQPMDRQRWFDFICSIHREKNSEFSSSMLLRWLQEVEHWSEEWANSLANQYENQRGLLSHADSQLVGA